MSAAQHIVWLNLVEKTGPFLALGVLEEAFPQGLGKVETRKRQRVRSAYEEWRDAVDAEDPQLDALHREWVRLVLEELLEFEPSILKPTDQLPPTLTYREPLTGAEVKPDFAVLSGGKARLLISCCAPDADLTAPLARETWTASPIERMIALCRATGVRVGLVTNGERWMLVSVPADGSSSLGTWFARIWQQETVTLQAFVSLLEVRRCFGPAESNLDSLFRLSLEHQNEVTDTLGEQVRRAVEVLVQALDRADLDRDRQLLKDVTPAQLYEAGLTVMMRLVVLLCAEERKLLLLGEPIYDQNYAVSTLRTQLREDKERLGDEVLERRHDAWARLLAVFRIVFGGIEHETLRLPALGGSLFDPDRFPFLEGRATGTSWRSTPAEPLPIDNRTVLMLLTALQVLEQCTGALLLSYEALDVEQIGHVYEGLLERTVKRVPETTLGLMGSQKVVNPNLPLRELEESKANGEDKLLAFLLEKTGRSESGLKNALKKKVDEPLYHRVLLACGSDIPLADRIKPWSHLLRTDSWGDPLAYRENSFIVTLGAGRRETGSHYTPKSLTEPIVQHTLEPLVYIGPAEGKPQSEWRLKSPREILALKVCDMAMGSGAFLVQTCRWLADRLVEAWDAAEKAGHLVAIEGEVLETGDAELLARDKADRVLIARRLIASRCLYGVDKNPMAVELAKVSLWLVTMMKGRPFSFLDHALKCGDSLLGVSSLKQIENFSLRPGEQQVTFATANLFRYVDEASRKRRELENLPSNDYAQIKAKGRLNAEAKTATAKVKALGDCLIAFELRGLDGETYEEQRAVATDHAEVAMRRSLQEFKSYAREQLRGRRPFHWPLEFPEVFARGGFDAFVGNPPFMGGRKISTNFGDDYERYVRQSILEGAKGSMNLVLYFFFRGCLALRPNGTAGLIATDAIKESDSREVGLKRVFEMCQVYRATSSREWPGEAGISICILHMTKGKWEGSKILDDVEVANISSMLEAGEEHAEPFQLVANQGCCSDGVKVQGIGFVLQDEEAQQILKVSPRYSEVITRYIVGDDLNNDPAQLGNRWVVNFWNRDQRDCERFEIPWSILVERVKPYRDSLTKQVHESCFWKFWDRREEFFDRVRAKEKVLVASKLSKHWNIAFGNPHFIYSEKAKVFDFSSFTAFAILQSSFHIWWALVWGSSTGGTPAYVGSRCFDTFPFPQCFKPSQGRRLDSGARDDQLEKVGKAYQDHRSEVVRARKEGLTDTYNRFHDSDERSADIARMRALHVEMDQVVAAAYAWADLDLGHGFHETKQGVRYTLSESARRTVLDRLLALNRQRYEEEVKAGLHEKKKSKRAGKNAKTTNDLFAL